jgi:outer membrane protein OmpA-like peptidoglycan-associated protein
VTGNRLTTKVAAALALMAAPLIAQLPNNPRELKATVLDLVFTVQDLGGHVQDLQIKETDTEIRMELAADVLFDFDKADLLPKAQAALKEVADLIREKARGNGAVAVEGHTDSKGSNVYNQRLSERRAVAVHDWLVTRGGLKGMHFTSQGFGSNRPVAPNKKPDGTDDPRGRQRNRRVEIVLKK